MFAKLGDYLEDHNIQRPTRYVSASGDEFVVLPAKEYTLLTGIDIKDLPTMETFDTVSDMPVLQEEEKNEDQETSSASALASILLEDEIGVDRLPL